MCSIISGTESCLLKFTCSNGWWWVIDFFLILFWMYFFYFVIDLLKLIYLRQTLTDRCASIGPLVQNTWSELDYMTWVGMEETLDLRWGSSVFSFFWHPKVMPRNHPAFLCQLFIPFCSLHNSSPTGSTSRKTTEIPARLAARSSIWLNMSRILEALFYMSSIGNCSSILHLFCFYYFWACPGMSFLMVTNEQMTILPFSSPPLTVFPSALGFPAQWHIMWLTMCLCHHSAWGKTHPVYHGLLARVQPSIQPVYFFTLLYSQTATM